MLNALVATGSATISWTLVISAVSHVSSFRDLKDALHEQAALPVPIQPLVAALSVVSESGLGLAGLALLWSASYHMLAVILVLAGALLLVYAAYLARLVAMGSVAPCGCSTSGGAISRLVVERNVALAIVGFGAAMGAPAIDVSHEVLVISSVAGLAFGVLGWIVPDALAILDVEGGNGL